MPITPVSSCQPTGFLIPSILQPSDSNHPASNRAVSNHSVSNHSVSNHSVSNKFVSNNSVSNRSPDKSNLTGKGLVSYNCDANITTTLDSLLPIPSLCFLKTIACHNLPQFLQIQFPSVSKEFFRIFNNKMEIKINTESELNIELIEMNHFS